MHSLPRSAVRLLPVPFPDAQTTALDRLLSPDTDRLPAPLRRETGLPEVAESYGNWENSAQLVRHRRLARSRWSAVPLRLPVGLGRGSDGWQGCGS